MWESVCDELGCRTSKRISYLQTWSTFKGITFEIIITKDHHMHLYKVNFVSTDSDNTDPRLTRTNFFGPAKFYPFISSPITRTSVNVDVFWRSAEVRVKEVLLYCTILLYFSYFRYIFTTIDQPNNCHRLVAIVLQFLLAEIKFWTKCSTIHT